MNIPARDAMGREPCHGDSATARVKALHAQNRIVREFSLLNGIPRSTVQRMKS